MLPSFATRPAETLPVAPTIDPVESMAIPLTQAAWAWPPISANKSTPANAAVGWLKANPQTVEPWLQGVTTVDGKEGLGAVKAALGLR